MAKSSALAEFAIRRTSVGCSAIPGAGRLIISAEFPLVHSFDASDLDLVSGSRSMFWVDPNRGKYLNNKRGITVTTLRAMSGPLTPEPSVLNPLPPAEQKRRNWLVVLVIMLAFMLIGIVTWMALIGTAGRAVDEGISKASSEPSQSHQAGEGRNAPREVTPGKAFTFGKHKMIAGWKVEQNTSLGDAMFGVTGKVKNISDDTSTAAIHFKVIDKSGEVLGNVQCNSVDLEPGQTQALNCIPDGNYGKYKTVTAAATS